MIGQRSALICGSGCRGCQRSTRTAGPALARLLNGFAGILFAVPLVAVALLAYALREAEPLLQGVVLLAFASAWTALLRGQRLWFQRRLAAVSANEPMALETVLTGDDYSGGDLRHETTSEFARSQE